MHLPQKGGNAYRTPVAPGGDPQIGRIFSEEPFFWNEDQWIPAPEDFSLNIC